MINAFDPLLIGVAVIIMWAGIARRRSLWRMGRDEDRSGDWGGLLKYLVGHKKILGNRNAGTAHLILFWGLIIPLLIIILAQFAFTLPRALALLLSLLTDILGALMLAGTLFFLIRWIKSTGLDRPKRTIGPLILLLIILLTGFLAEGTRLSIVHPHFTWSSPVGWLCSKVLPGSPLLMQVMIRLHFFAALLFIAMVPFTFMRHLTAGTLNVFYRKRGSRGELRRLTLGEEPLGARSVGDLSWKQLLDAEACVSCGRCEENCPAYISGKPLSPRKLIRNILEQMGEGNSSPLLEDTIKDDEIWSCTTCMACVEHCPVFIEPLDKIIDMRRYRILDRGLVPAEAKPMIRDLEIYGDVNGKGIAHRGDWAINRDVPRISAEDRDVEILLWVGCFGAFHPRYQETTRDMVKILKSGGVRFGILAGEEVCCGDPARRLGEEALFLDLALKNISRFQQYDFQKIVTLCPHCFNTLKNEYPAVASGSQSGPRMDFEVAHAAEFVMDLIRQGRISMTYPVTEKTAVHDPCYLGRANGIYEPLREVIRGVPGIELRELQRNRENGFCCGGGGGRMWLHENTGCHINKLRAEEVSEAGVGLLGTACPYCLTMLDDGIKALEMEKPPKVMDVIEIVASSLG